LKLPYLIAQAAIMVNYNAYCQGCFRTNEH
jgi:predicted Fe-S protein YdhL (DUF1289 family)